VRGSSDFLLPSGVHTDRACLGKCGAERRRTGASFIGLPLLLDLVRWGCETGWVDVRELQTTMSSVAGLEGKSSAHGLYEERGIFALAHLKFTLFDVFRNNNADHMISSCFDFQLL
jgi:hypothetical protein